MKKPVRILWLMRDDGDMTEPMNIMLLSAIAQFHNPERERHLALIERDDIFSVIRDYKPDIVAASAITGAHKYYLEAFRQIKKKFGNNIFTLLGGPYCSTYPDVIARKEFLDAVGVFECDDAWSEFLHAFETQPDDIHTTLNFLTRENYEKRLEYDNGIANVRRDCYHDRRSALDELPFMDRSLIYDNTAFAHRYKRTHMAGRGCPFRCTYCFEHDWNNIYRKKGKLFQRYSPERFCTELKWVMERYDTRFWKFYDDVFPTFHQDKEWLEEFAEMYPKVVGLPFHCLTRCDLVAHNPDVLTLLKKAGIASLTMSIESGNAFIRDHIIKRDMTTEQMTFAFREAHKLGIKTFANTILGIPGPIIPATDATDFAERVEDIISEMKHGRPEKSADELSAYARNTKTKEARENIIGSLRKVGLHATQLAYDIESVQANLDWKVSFGEYPVLHPYPRTETTRWLMEKGWFDGDFDKLHASYQNRSPLPCFTEREKAVQQNLALLGTFCMLFTGSRSFMVRTMGKPISWFALSYCIYIHAPLAVWLFEQLYALSKSYMHETRMYPIRRSLPEKIKFYREMWNLDFWKQFGNTTWFKRFRRPGHTLGGPRPE